MRACYLCGANENLTKDHIPPRSFFPLPYPNDLITIDCCKKCNELASLDDEAFRAFVSSTINRSPAGKWIWENRVMKSTFVRSPKFKEAIIKSIVPVKTLINGVQVPASGIKYPIKRARNFLIRLVKGFTKHFNPEIDYSSAKFRVRHIVPSQHIADMLYAKFFYVEKGDRVFRMWRMFAKGEGARSAWVFVFYDDLMFMVEMFDPKEQNPSV